MTETDLTTDQPRRSLVRTLRETAAEESTSHREAAAEESTSTAAFQLQFGDFADLNTRLALMPRVADRGIGAIVASYYEAKNSSDDVDDDDGTDSASSSSVAAGYVVKGMVSGDGKEVSDWRDKQFRDILESLREAPGQIILRLERPVTESSFSSQKAEDFVDEELSDKTSYQETVLEEEKKTDTEDRPSLLPSLMDAAAEEKDDHGDDEGVSGEQNGCTSDEPSAAQSHGKRSSQRGTLMLGGVDLAAWGSRVRETAVKASSSAAAMARAAQERAAKPSLPPAKNANNCGIYTQNRSGFFVALPRKKASDIRPTNTSLLLVRLSATQPCPAAGHAFQWYRSKSCAASDEWEELQGASTAAFQPSATEVGRRLRCVVTVTSSFDEDEEGNGGNIGTTHKYVCETANTVAADLALFNGARQALVRGAHFAGLAGRGKAAGRNFRCKIEIAATKKKKSTRKVTSAVTLYQLSGSTAEPIHPVSEPIRCVSAGTDPSHAKNFELIFAGGLPESAPMVAALSDLDAQGLYRFELQASNRLARESLLLALGIANYAGEPADLNESMVLYDQELAPPKASDDDGSSSLSSSSTTDDETSVKSLSSEATGSSRERPPLPPTTVDRHNNILADSSAFRQRSTSLDSARLAKDSSQRVRELEQELHELWSKLARKDKVVSELHRSVARQDQLQRLTEQKLTIAEQDLLKSRSENEMLQQSLKKAEAQIESHGRDLEKMQREEASKILRFEEEGKVQAARIAELEKASRTLQNENAVLSAAVEARESKLAKMAELQKSFDEASDKLTHLNSIEQKLAESNRRYREVCADVERISLSEKERSGELDQATVEIESLKEQLKSERSKTALRHAELERDQMKVQKLKAERNSYKQKGDSLAREMGRICRNGLTVRQVEKILADDAARRHEVELLREQKRRALEDLQHYRTAYEQSKMAAKLAGIDHDSAKLLERNAELERLLSELTEYVSAKEMQLDTMKQVNETLQSEIRDMARSTMSKNDI